MSAAKPRRIFAPTNAIGRSKSAQKSALEHLNCPFLTEPKVRPPSRRASGPTAKMIARNLTKCRERRKSDGLNDHDMLCAGPKKQSRTSAVGTQTA